MKEFNMVLISFISQHATGTLRSCSTHADCAYYVEYEDRIIFMWRDEPRYEVTGLDSSNIIKFRELAAELPSNYSELADILRDIRDGRFVSIDSSIEDDSYRPL